eukprot:gene26828-biopygen17417
MSRGGCCELEPKLPIPRFVSFARDRHDVRKTNGKGNLK